MMRLFVSGASSTMQRLGKRLGYNVICGLGHLLTPDNFNDPNQLLRTGLPYAVDNAAFSGFDRDRFLALVRKVSELPFRPAWIALPDVVGDARRTFELAPFWAPLFMSLEMPFAIVAQDGSEALDWPWEWPYFRCVFLGGSTEWKLSQASADVAHAAKAAGKKVHMGRVNSLKRLQAAQDRDCDSIDGTGCNVAPDKNINKILRWMRRLDDQSALPFMEIGQ